MYSYKMLISYDGTNYNGWQIQPRDPKNKNLNTVSGVIQDVFKRVFKKDIKLIGASRTDAGVHAVGQVAKFNLDVNIEPNIILRALNNSLPRDVFIRKISYINFDFNPRAKVSEKIYYYNFSLNKTLPFIANYVYYLKSNIDLDKLKLALNLFVGTHDFRSFCTGFEHASTIRTINSIDMIYLKKFKIYQIKITGNSFLRYMIRRIVGASIDIACSYRRSIDEISFALEEKNPLQIFTKAPARGLILRKIIYKSG